MRRYRRSGAPAWGGCGAPRPPYRGAMPSTHPPSESAPDARAVGVNPVSPAEPVRVPRHRLPDQGLDSEIAYQVVHDELMLDGNARLNLATFVTTWIEPRAKALLAESF